MHYTVCHPISPQEPEQRGKSGETEGKQHRRTKGATGMGQQGDKSGKRHRRAGQWPDGTETKTVICRVGSERSPCPVLMCSWRQEADALHGAGYVSVCIVTAGWNKISPSGFFPFDPVLMRRRSLRLPSLNPFPNSDGNTGAFFARKITAGNFLYRKPEA